MADFHPLALGMEDSTCQIRTAGHGFKSSFLHRFNFTRQNYRWTLLQKGIQGVKVGMTLINYPPTYMWSAPFPFFVRLLTQTKLSCNRCESLVGEVAELAMGASVSNYPKIILIKFHLLRAQLPTLYRVLCGKAQCSGAGASGSRFTVLAKFWFGVQSIKRWTHGGIRVDDDGFRNDSYAIHHLPPSTSYPASF